MDRGPHTSGKGEARKKPIVSHIIVRTYRADRAKAFEKDANKLARKGYTVVSTTRQPGHLGTSNRGLNTAIAITTGGLGLLMTRTPAQLTVTYQKA